VATFLMHPVVCIITVLVCAGGVFVVRIWQLLKIVWIRRLVECKLPITVWLAYFLCWPLV